MRVWWFCLWLLYSCAAKAAFPVGAEVFTGKASCEAIWVVRASEPSEWTKLKPGDPSRSGDIWVRMPLPPAWPPQTLVIPSEFARQLWIYRPGIEDPEFRSIFTRRSPQDGTAYWYRIPLLAPEPGQLLLCLRSPQATPSLMQVLPEARQVERELNLRALVAASVAVIVAMASFALIFGFVLRDQIYFWYCAHLFNFMIWYSVSSWLLGQSVSLGVDAARWLLIIPTIFSALSTYFVTLFAVNFMALQLHYPRWSRLLQSASFVILMLGLLSVLTLWLPIPRRWLVNAQNLSLGLLTLALLATAIRLAFRGQRYARYFATGWTPLLILVVISVISSLQDAYVAQLLRVALLPAVAFEAFLLSIGLADRTLALKLERDAAMQAAERDSLTGVLNRRGFEGRWAAQAASDQPGALLICDLDHFKRINDQYGHPAGDQCLKRFAERAERVLPPDALLGRFGGEEFLVYLPSADGGEAQRQAERLRAEIAAAPVVVESESICLTVSIGVLIRRPGSRETLTIAIARADAALYRAKSEGRNRVVIAESDARA